MNYLDLLQAIENDSAALEALLTEECAALEAAPQHSNLLALAERKTLLSTRLQALEAQRQGFLSSHPEVSPMLPDNIRSSLANCHRLNQQVGAHVSSQLRYTRRALDILGLGDEGSVYTANGVSQVNNNSHALAKA